MALIPIHIGARKVRVAANRGPGDEQKAIQPVEIERGIGREGGVRGREREREREKEKETEKEKEKERVQ